MTETTNGDPKGARLKLFADLSEKRAGNEIISYVTSTRSGFEVQMAMDVIPVLYAHLRNIKTAPSETKIDLFIHSNGGDGVVPWRLVTLVREFCSEFNVIVPNRAFSAATLTALGADNIIMHPMGILGPTDPTITTPFNPQNPLNPGQPLGISVEDVSSFIALVKEDFGIRHEDELVQAFLALTSAGVHPLALGTVKRSTSQSRMLGEKLLASRVAADLSPHERSELIKSLTSQLFYHGHPISRGEARESVGLKFVKDASADEEKGIWDLFEAYEHEMSLFSDFRPLDALIASLPLPAAPAQQGMNSIHQSEAKIDSIIGAAVESRYCSHVQEANVVITATKQWTGQVTGQVQVANSGWRQRW
jgi:Serine dehydrogenase proteinase